MAFVVCNLFHLLFLGVHLAHYVRRLDVCVRLVVNWTSRIEFESRLFHSGERLSVAAFVAERPEQYTRVVAIGAHHVSHTPANLLRPRLVRARNASCKSVSFKVVFAHNHDAVLVAKLVKITAVGIV